MRVKPVPEPPADIETVVDAHRAVPLVPTSEADCCARLMDRLELESRDEARIWLTFLRGLGLIESGARGYARRRTAPDADELRAAVVAGVFGAREIIALLDDAAGPRPSDWLANQFMRQVPPWERHRHPGTWRERWHRRVERLLGWLAQLGWVERHREGYISTRTEGADR